MASYRGLYRYTRMADGDIYAATQIHLDEDITLLDGADGVIVGYAHRHPAGWRYSRDGEHVVGPVYDNRDLAIDFGPAYDREAM